MINLLLSIILILIVTSFGLKLFRWYKLKFTSFAEELAFSSAFGLGILAYITLTIGSLKLLYGWMAWSIVILFAFISYGEIAYLSKNIIYSVKTQLKQKTDIFSFLLVSFLMVHILINLIGSLAPPTVADALVYHLAVPKLYIQHHGIYYIPFNSFSNLPSNVGMLFLFGMLLRSDVLSVLLHFFMSIILIFAIYSLTKKYFSHKFALLAVTIFYCNPGISIEASSAYVDLGVSLFGFLSVFSFYNYIYNNIEKVKWLVISAVFAGLAAGSKIYGPVWAIILAILCIIAQLYYMNKDFKNTLLKTIRNVALISVISFAVASPWYVKNMVFTGNPFYPKLSNVFKTKGWSSDMEAHWKESMKSKVAAPYGRNISGLITAPFKYTFSTKDPATGESRIRDVDIGPLFLIFLLIYPFVRSKNNISKNVTLLFIIFFLYYFFWYFFNIQRVRHMYGALAILSVPAAYTFFALFAKKGIFRYLSTITLFLAFLFSLGASILYSHREIPVVFGFQTKENFLQSHALYYDAFQWVNKNLPPHSRLYYWDNVGGYYLDVDYIWGIESSVIDWKKMADKETVLQELKCLSITHVLLVGSKDHYSEKLNWRKFAEIVMTDSEHFKLIEKIKSFYTESRAFSKVYGEYHPINIYEINYDENI